jgi:hypothetical protein
MELEKATVQTYDPETGDLGEPVKVLFNPTQYSLNKANQFAEVGIPGLDSPPLQFVRGNVRTLSMQLFFDSYELGEDVRDYTQEITSLTEIDPELHAPPVCMFSWGDFVFVGVLQSANQSFLLFTADGTPVRATVDVTFKEYVDQPGDRQSVDFAKHYTVRRGDTLSGVAAKKLGDPARWRPIAVENGIDDPLSIEPGQVLVIPAIK